MIGLKVSLFDYIYYVNFKLFVYCKNSTHIALEWKGELYLTKRSQKNNNYILLYNSVMYTTYDKILVFPVFYSDTDP